MTTQTTQRDLSFKELYEALYDMPQKTNALFDALDKASPLVAQINREINKNKTERS